MNLPRDTVGGAARAAFFALLPAVAAGGAMALPVAITLTGLVSFRPSLLRQAVENRPLPLLFLIAFVGWACLSSLWSTYDVHTTALKLAVLIPVGLLFAAAVGADARAARFANAAALAALIATAGLLAIEALGDLPLARSAEPNLPDGELNRNPSRGVTVMLAMSWPLAAGLLAVGGVWRWVLAGGVLLATALLTPAFGQDANLVAFVLGLGAFGAAFVAPRFAILATSGAFAVWLLVAPFLTPLIVASPRLVDAVPDSWVQRIGIWRYVCARIVEQPWFGYGLDASRAVTDRVSIHGMEFRAVSGHPHSASLQIWFETGAVGALLAATTLMVGGWTLSRTFAENRPAAAATAASFAALGVIANVSFSIWQEWWVASLFLAAALINAMRLKGAKA